MRLARDEWYTERMIIVHGIFPIREDARSKALALMEEMSSLSRKEPGCLTYEFYAALSSDTEFLLFQEWESVDALQDHFETPHMETFLSELPEVLNGEIMTRRYEVRSRERDARTSRQSTRRSKQSSMPEQTVPKIIH